MHQHVTLASSPSMYMHAATHSIWRTGSPGREGGLDARGPAPHDHHVERPCATTRSSTCLAPAASARECTETTRVQFRQLVAKQLDCMPQPSVTGLRAHSVARVRRLGGRGRQCQCQCARARFFGGGGLSMLRSTCPRTAGATAQQQPGPERPQPPRRASGARPHHPTDPRHVRVDWLPTY